MGGTRFIVLQLRDIIKTALIALCVIVLIIAVVILLPKTSGGAASAARYAPGTYSSQLSLKNEPVGVEVKVTKDGIESISLKGASDKSQAFYPLLQPALDNLTKEIVAAQNLNVSLSAKNPVTDQVLLDGIKAALAQAQVKKF